MHFLLKNLYYFLGMGVVFSVFAIEENIPKVIINIANYPPHYENNPPYYGLDGKLLWDAFEKVGVPMGYKWYKTWKEAFDAAKINRESGTTDWACNKDRAKDFYFSVPLSTLNFALFYYKDNHIDWNTIEDFSKIGLIGLTAGYYYGDAVDVAKKNKSFFFDVVETDEQNLRQLIFKRKQAVVLDVSIGYELLKRKYPDQKDRITHHPKLVSVMYGHLLLNKMVPFHRDAIKKIDEALIELGVGKYHPDFVEIKDCVENSFK